MLLGIVMLQARDTKWRDVIEAHAQEAGLSVEQWKERTMDTALIELQKHK